MAEIVSSSLLLATPEAFICAAVALLLPGYVLVPVKLARLLKARRPRVWRRSLVVVLMLCGVAIWVPYHFRLFAHRNTIPGGPGDIERMLWFLLWILFLLPSFIYLGLVAWFRPRGTDDQTPGSD